jgi:hypothetical protein
MASGAPQVPVNPVFALNYIDKVSAALLETGKGVNRALITSLTMSLVVTGLCFGSVSIDQKITFGGTSLNVPFSVILVGCSWVIAMAFTHCVALTSHETRLRDVILRLYRDIGFSDPSLDDLIANPLEYPNVFTTVTSRDDFRIGPIGNVFDLILMVIVLLLPTLSIGFAHFRLWSLVGGRWWVVSSLVSCVSLMLLSIVALFR